MASWSAVTVSSLVVRAAAVSWPTMMPLMSARLDTGVANVCIRFGAGIFHPGVQALHAVVSDARHGDHGHVGGLTATGRWFLRFPVATRATARRAHDRPPVLRRGCAVRTNPGSTPGTPSRPR